MPALRRCQCVVVAAVLSLSACSYSDSIFGAPLPSGTTNPAPAAASSVTARPLAGTPATGSAEAAPNSSTGTYVGQKVDDLRRDLQQLADSLARHRQDLQQTRQVLQQDATAYFTTVAGINGRLQVGTTPGNPQLVAQWNAAQMTLDHMSDDMARLNSISNQAASDSSRASYLLDSTRAAFALQGAVDEDHRNLTQIETQINQEIVQIDQLLTELSDEIGRQSTYVGNERSNLVTLSLAIKNGQLYGPSLASRAFGPGGSAAAAPLLPPSPATPARTGRRRADVGRPLVVIRFDRPDVPYEEALYTAVSRALERRPDASFDLVAVAPNSGTAAQTTVNANTSKHNAENVLRSLTGMGLPADRLTLSAQTSPDVQSNEVRIYVR